MVSIEKVCLSIEKVCHAICFKLNVQFLMTPKGRHMIIVLSICLTYCFKPKALLQAKHILQAVTIRGLCLFQRQLLVYARMTGTTLCKQMSPCRFVRSHLDQMTLVVCSVKV